MKKTLGRILTTVVIVGLFVWLLMPGRGKPQMGLSPGSVPTAASGDKNGNSDETSEKGDGISGEGSEGTESVSGGLSEEEELLPQWEERAEKERSYREEKGDIGYDMEDPSTWVINPDFYREPGEEMLDSFRGISYCIKSMAYVDRMEDYPSRDYAESSLEFLTEEGELIPTYERAYEDKDGQISYQEAAQKILKVRVTAENLYDNEMTIYFTPNLAVLKQVEGEWYYDEFPWRGYYPYNQKRYNQEGDASLYRMYADGYPFYIRCINRNLRDSIKSFYQIDFGPKETLEIEFAMLMDTDLMENTYLCFNFTGTRYNYYEMSYFLVSLPEV